MSQPATAAIAENPSVEFSVVEGGPFYHLWLRTGLARQHLELPLRRTLFFVLLTWLPLLLLSSFHRERIATPFLADLDVQVRLLVALPVFLLGELYNGRHLRTIVRQFVDRHIVAPKDCHSFDAIIASTARLRDSWIGEVGILIAAFTLGIWLWKGNHPPNMSTWYVDVSDGSFHYTPAGYWLVFFVVPMFHFITLRWLWRIALWYQFLWRVSRLPLSLNLYHPDKMGGLGFLEKSTIAFAPILVPYSAILAGLIGNRIWHSGARLAEFRMDIAALAVVEALLVLLPLTFFMTTLETARWRASREFGTLASAYVDAFREKWVRGGLPQSGKLLGTPDLQSLADLGNSYQSARALRAVPISKGILVTLAAVILGPMLPLAITVMPVEEIIKHVLKVVL